MLSVASLPIGAPGPTLHWRNTDMEQVVFMVMVINFMMMMKVMMPELAQHRHGAGDLVMVVISSMVIIVMTLHWLKTDIEPVIFVVFIMSTMVTMVMMKVIMLLVLESTMWMQTMLMFMNRIHVTYSSQPEKLRYYSNFHKLYFIVETTEKQNYNIPNFTPRSVLILHNIPFLSACWELLHIFMVKSKSFAWHTAINLKVQHFVTRSLNPFIRIL